VVIGLGYDVNGLDPIRLMGIVLGTVHGLMGTNGLNPNSKWAIGYTMDKKIGWIGLDKGSII